MAGGAKPITGRLPVKRTYKNYPDAILRQQAAMQSRDARLLGRGESSQGMGALPPLGTATDLMGPPTTSWGMEDVTIDDGFMEILKEMSPDLMEKYRQQDISGDPYAPRSAGRVGSQVRHPYGGAWDRPPLSMAPWLKKKRRV
jgi:hypothetical protein